MNAPTAAEKPILPNEMLAYAFSNPWIGFILAALILAGAGAIIVFNYRRHYAPITRALQERLRATRIIADQEHDADAQDVFVAHLDSIEEAMLSGGKEAAELRHAWTQFSETIVDKNQSPLQATTRPDGYFLHLGDDTRVLAWWANIFVALGLTFTFLGIIGALSKAVASMSGGDMATMQLALMQLLVITAAKFWTSVGGVIASVILRWFDRRWHSRTQHRLEMLCERLEFGTLFSPPQRVAAEQLHELRQQSVALTEFSNNLAAAIGDALGNHMQPVVAGLSGIQTSLNEFREGSFNQIGKELGQAISQNAGHEMQALAGALAQMSAGMDSVRDQLAGASGEASEQIAMAAREFSAASEAMTRAFAGLNTRIEAMASRMEDQSKAAEQRILDRVAEDRASYDAIAQGQRDAMAAVSQQIGSAASMAGAEMVQAVRSAVGEAMSESTVAIRSALTDFAGATSGIQTAFDHMKGQIAELGDRLAGSAGDAADRNAQVLARAAEALEGAAARAHSGIGEALDHAINRSAIETERALTAAFASFGERFEAASGQFVQILSSAVGRMEVLAQSIERSTAASDTHATRLVDAGRQAQQVGTLLGRAANDVAEAAEPIRTATTAIRVSFAQSQELLRRLEQSGKEQLEAMEDAADAIEAVSEAMGKTSASAGQAWESYRERFEDVDENLAKALEQIRSASAEHASALNTEIGKMDQNLATAVGRFASAVDDIKDLADALEDVRGRTLTSNSPPEGER